MQKWFVATQLKTVSVIFKINKNKRGKEDGKDDEYEYDTFSMMRKTFLAYHLVRLKLYVFLPREKKMMKLNFLEKMNNFWRTRKVEIYLFPCSQFHLIFVAVAIAVAVDREIVKLMLNTHL